MKKLLSLLSATALVIASSVTALAAPAPTSLTFAEDGTFKILHLTDTQDDQNPSWDMLNLLKKTIAQTQPDLIVFTGDLVEDSRIGDLGIDNESFREGVLVKKGGKVDHDATLKNIEIAADAVLSVFEESGVPYAIALGNNDYKCSVTTAEWLQIFARYPHCLATDLSNDAEGRADYNLLIKDKSGAVKCNLWLMDTGRHSVNAEQIAWYKSTAANLTAENGGTPVPALVFQHVEVDEIGKLFVPCMPWDDGATGRNGEFVRLNREVAKGSNVLAYPEGDTDEFKAWKECGDVMGAFFGHEHVEGFSGTVDGIELGFTYGSEMAKVGPYGGRLITLHENDIKNYDNDVYRYTGKVKLGTDKVAKVADNPQSTPDNPLLQVLFGIKNTAVSVVLWIVSLF